jgi:signal transduction histidine kinase
MPNSKAQQEYVQLNLISENETKRVEKLLEMNILDTAPEVVFDQLALLASQIFHTPNAFITFVDKERVFFKANLSNLEVSEILRKDSLCSISIMSDAVTVFDDTHKVPELMPNEYVVTRCGIRFYAAAPLKTKDGFLLGTICVTDEKPNSATSEQLDMLKTLSMFVINELEWRISSKKALSVQTDLINRVVHDLKNPLASISLGAELLSEDLQDITMVDSLCKTISRNAIRIESNLNELLEHSKIEGGAQQPDFEIIVIEDLLKSVISNMKELLHRKNQMVFFENTIKFLVRADRKRLVEVFDNLISNAIKFSEYGRQIVISTLKKGNKIVIGIKDEGQGLDKSDVQKLFVKFARLSSHPTARETSHGLGLSIVKALVEFQDGSVWAESEGKNKGTTFFVSLPMAS